MSDERKPRLVDDGWRSLDIEVLDLSEDLEADVRANHVRPGVHIDTIGDLSDYQLADHRDFSGLDGIDGERQEALQSAWARFWSTREARETGRTPTRVIVAGDNHDPADV